MSDQKELSETKKDKLSLEVAKRLDSIVKLFCRPEDNFGKTIGLTDLPIIYQQLMMASFQEGIKYWQEQRQKLDEEFMKNADIPF